MDKRLQRYLRLVYSRVLGEVGIAGCSRRSEIYLGGVGRGGLMKNLALSAGMLALVLMRAITPHHPTSV